MQYRFKILQLLLIVLIAALSITQAHSAEGREKNPEEKEKEPEGKEKNDDEKDKENESGADDTIKIGILAFSTSQQLAPLVSFGQNLLDKKQAQALLLTSYLKGDDEYFITLVPSLLYAFTDHLSLFLSEPIAVRFRQDDHHSSGPGDAIIQLEYGFYTKSYWTFYDQATLVANVTIPTGSMRKNPNTGIGSNSFFIGATYARTGIDWYVFTGQGGIFTATKHQTRFGNAYLYQFGVGRRIASTKDWLFAWLLELDGTYFGRNRVRGIVDPDSGGNVIFLTPSLWISSSESFLLQFGVGLPIYEHLLGHQIKDDYALELNVGWTF